MATRRRYALQISNSIYKVKATALSLLSRIFVILNGQRLRLNKFCLFPVSEPYNPPPPPADGLTTEMPWQRLRGKTPNGTRHGNDYRSVKEKQGIVYQQRYLQTVISLGVVSLAFWGHDLLKIANFNPQQEARFSLWKKLVPRESGGNGA